MAVLKSRTIIYHGTRWQDGQDKWWKTGFPNKEGEDGGVSYCLDKISSPKILRAQVIIEYRLIKDLEYRVCDSKAKFWGVFRDSQSILACWTHQENELSMRLIVQGAYLEYYTDSLEQTGSCVIM